MIWPLAALLILSVAQPTSLDKPLSCDLTPFNNLGWNAEPTTAAAQHQELRTKAGAKLPKRSDIAIFGRALHHSSYTFSLLLSRGRDGQWIIDGADEAGPGLLGGPTSYARFVEPLTPAESAGVEGILSDPCLLKEPRSSFDRNIVAGGTVITVEIAPPIGRMMRAHGKVPGINGKLLDLVYEAANRGKNRAAAKRD